MLSSDFRNDCLISTALSFYRAIMDGKKVKMEDKKLTSQISIYVNNIDLIVGLKVNSSVFLKGRICLQ